MKVTPVKKPFNRHKVGEVFDLPDRSAKILIRVGKLKAADDPVVVKAAEPVAPVEVKAPEPYETRMLAADRVATVSAAPAKRPYVRRTQPAKD